MSAIPGGSAVARSSYPHGVSRVCYVFPLSEVPLLSSRLRTWSVSRATE
jgi:hypothetical protein